MTLSNSRNAPVCVAALASCLLMIPSAQARVVRIVIDTRQPQQNYQRLSGHFFGELDPKDPLNAIINDLSLSPMNAKGRVEYSATFTLLLPTDPSKADGVLIYGVPNRGNSPINGFATDAMPKGQILLSSGWQADLAERPGAETVKVPIAKNHDGSPVTGPVLYRFENAGGTTQSMAAGYPGLHYQVPLTLDTTKAHLTKQASDDGQIIPIPSADWAFANCDTKPFPGEPDPTRLCLKGGFDSAMAYQVVFTAKDPLVLGIGLAATRDIVSFFRYAAKDDSGTANPIAGIVKHVVAYGDSQSGNFIKTFLHLGFNEDESKRIVWDGANPNIAARQNPLNFRFAIPGGATGLYEPGSEPVLWWSTYKDDARSRPAASLLDRCTASKTCPKIVETFGATEFWGLRMSPGLVGTKADKDIPLPANVRRYYFPGVTHNGGRGGFQLTDAAAAGGSGNCELPNNPNSSSEYLRAIRAALVDWVTTNTAPPPSRYPTLAAGDLVEPVAQAMGFPSIPGRPLPDNILNPVRVYDFGPKLNYNDLSGTITMQPPAIKGTLPMLAPKTNSDGNETSGIPSVLLQAPLGSYLGWNVTANGYEKGRTCGFSGGFIPFARTKAERIASGDPRPSIEERYPNHEAYVEKIRAAAQQLVKERYLLQPDADRLISQAEASNIAR